MPVQLVLSVNNKCIGLIRTSVGMARMRDGFLNGSWTKNFVHCGQEAMDISIMQRKSWAFPYIECMCRLFLATGLAS